MIWLRSLIFNILFFTWTAFMLVFCTPLLLAPAAWVEAGQRFWARGVLGLLRRLNGLDWHVIGEDRRPDRAVLYAFKHQSAWDTVIVHLLFDSPVVVLKRELLFIPFYGWYAWKTGHIPIRRSRGSAALRRILRMARKRIDAGRPILIFPEGTRVAPGAQAPFLPGIAGLYAHLDLPVVPVALNSGLFWPRRSFLKTPGTITVAFLEPIEPGLPRKEFMRLLRERLETATDRLIAPASGDSDRRTA